MYQTYVVSESWLISPTAKKVYVASAVLTVFFFGVLMTIVFAAALAGGTLAQAPLLASVLKALLFISLMGTALLWIGMWYFWYRFHPGSDMSKALWAAIILVSGPVGALLYFLAVYLRSPEVRERAKAQAATA
jgi:hypothetical protein